MPYTSVYNFDFDDSGFPPAQMGWAEPDITSDLLLEWNADNLGAIGSNVTGLASSAGSLGSAADLSLVSTSKPTVVAGPNGHKAIRSDKALSQWMRTALFASALTLPMTQCFVLKRRDTGTQSIVSGWFDTASRFIGMNWQTAGYGAGAGASGEVINSYANADVDNYHLHVIRHGEHAMYSLDGVEATGVTGATAPAAAVVPRFTLFGSSAATPTQLASIDFSFGRIYGRALTDEDIRSLVATLKPQFAIV